MQNDMTIDGQKISTWYSPHMDLPYHAVAMTAAIEMLKGYNLTDDEKTSLPELMGGYCRLIDEAGFIGYGQCEFEAIQDLFGKAAARARAVKLGA